MSFPYQKKKKIIGLRPDVMSTEERLQSSQNVLRQYVRRHLPIIMTSLICANNGWSGGNLRGGFLSSMDCCKKADESLVHQHHHVTNIQLTTPLIRLRVSESWHTRYVQILNLSWLVRLDRRQPTNEDYFEGCPL